MRLRKLLFFLSGNLVFSHDSLSVGSFVGRLVDSKIPSHTIFGMPRNFTVYRSNNLNIMESQSSPFATEYISLYIIYGDTSSSELLKKRRRTIILSFRRSIFAPNPSYLCYTPSKFTSPVHMGILLRRNFKNRRRSIILS